MAFRKSFFFLVILLIPRLLFAVDNQAFAGATTYGLLSIANDRNAAVNILGFSLDSYGRHTGVLYRVRGQTKTFSIQDANSAKGVVLEAEVVVVRELLRSAPAAARVNASARPREEDGRGPGTIATFGRTCSRKTRSSFGWSKADARRKCQASGHRTRGDTRARSGGIPRTCSKRGKWTLRRKPPSQKRPR